VFAVAAAIEHSHAPVKLLAEDPILGAPVAGDRARRPGPAAWAGYSLGVERVRERARRRAAGVGAKDPADDFGLVVIDGQAAALGDICLTVAPKSDAILLLQKSDPVAGAALRSAKAWQPRFTAK
jgi:hypothetical protein